MIRDEKLDFWIKNGYNALFVGKHGVGKTAVVTQAFDRAGLKWKYFSASTMDPWVDFVGVPREAKTPDGKSYLDLVRPREFQEDQVEALFFDEFNRSSKKVRNAVMELLQFKSVNGKKFNNLKIVWAAINPDDENQQQYDVEKLDPAQADRFHVKVDVPYEPSLDYFITKFGKMNAKSALSWWQELPKDEKDKVSPRRLDYALDIWLKKGDLRDVLPASSNIGKLLTVLRSGPIADQLEKFRKDKDAAAAKKFLSNENNYDSASKHILDNAEQMAFFLPLLGSERLTTLMSKNKAVLTHITANVTTEPVFKQIVLDVLAARTNRALIKQIMANVPAEHRQLAAIGWPAQLQQIKNMALYNTQDRIRVFNIIKQDVPASITLKDAEDVLDVLSKIVEHSHYYTLSGPRFKELPKVMSTLFQTVAAQKNLNSPAEIFKHYGKRFQRLKARLDAANLTARLTCQPEVIAKKA